MFRSSIDRYVAGGLRVIAAFTCSLVVLLFIFLFRESWSSLHQVGFRVLSDGAWLPAETASQGEFGMTPMLVGSVLVMVGSVCFAGPLGVASAVFCQFYAGPSLAAVYRRLVELLAGIPSVVFGFWGLVVLAPLIARWQPPGPSLLAGVIIVGLMILPTVMLVVESSLAATPRNYIVGAAALGLGRWSVVWRVVLPAARSGIATGIVLGASRAVGETMAVVLVCGNVAKIPAGVFDPVRTLTANIALEMGYALGDHQSALFASGLFLLVICSLLLGVAHWARQATVGGEAGV